MKQVHLGLFLCLLLAINVTGQYDASNYLGNHFAGSQVGAEQTDLSGYGDYLGANPFGNYFQYRNNRLPSRGRLTDVPSVNNFGQYNQQSSSFGSAWLPTSDPYIANKQRVINENVPSSFSNPQVLQRDQTFNTGANVAQPNNSNIYRFGRPYTEPTGPPFGIQSTGEILSYLPEKLDLSKCGPLPTANPCTVFRSQYHALPGYPNCYIQCAFGRPTVKPCPADLVWNTRINTCDWPTVAPSVEFDDDNTTPYGNNQYKAYSYRRKKRSTTERKKRNVAGFGTQGQYPGFYGFSSQMQKGPLRIPLTPYNLPGPVSFSGHVGFAGIPPQYAGSQSLIASLPQPATPLKPIAFPAAPPASSPLSFVPTGQLPTATLAPPALPPPSVPTQLPITSDSSVQARFNVPSGNLYADAYNPTVQTVASAVPATVPPAPTTDSLLTATTNLQPSVMAAAPQLSNFFYPQLNVPTPSPFSANSPVSFEATLIPGPFYPYGPPHGGPFGGPKVKPEKKPKPSIVDVLKKLGYLGGQSMSPFGLYGTQGFSPATRTDSQSQLSARYYGSQYLPGGYSFGGQSYQNFMPFAGQQFQGFSPFQMFGYPYDTTSASSKRPALPPFGSDFELIVPPEYEDESEDADANEDENEDEDYDSSSETTNQNDDKASDKNKSAKSNDKEKKEKKESEKKQNRRKRASNIYDIAASDSMRKQFLTPNQILYSPYSQSSPCVHSQPGTNTAHPIDNTKYIACLNKFYYVVMSCPNSLVYNPVTNRCEKRRSSEAICEHEQPCLNGGQCYQTSSTTYKCTCVSGWTGEKCETPFSSCANNPCGSGNQCLTLRVNDYKQDYVCVCDENKSYGSSCGQNTIPNPCLAETTTGEQYYPFAFSTQAFIQCNGNLLYARPCTTGLVWNEKEKVCDRIETTSDEGLLLSYDVVYGRNEQPRKTVQPGTTVTDQKFVKTESNQQKLDTSNQEQINIHDPNSSSDRIIMTEQPLGINPSRSRSWRPTHHNNVMAQEQPVLVDETLSSTSAASTETPQTQFIKPVYEEVFYESPQIPVMMRQPLVRPYYRPFRP